MDPPQHFLQKERRSIAFFLEQLGEGSVEKEPQFEGEDSLTFGAQELEWQETAEAEAVVELEPDLEQCVQG